MEREAGNPGYSKKLRHDRRRAMQKAKKDTVLPIKRADGTLDVTPHIASQAIRTKGKYLKLGRGFLVRG